MSGGMWLTTRVVAHVSGFRTATCIHVPCGVGLAATADYRMCFPWVLEEVNCNSVRMIRPLG